MNQSLERKLAKLVTYCEETDRGGVTYGGRYEGYRQSVWPEVVALMYDPEVAAWLDELRSRNEAPLRRP